MNGLSLPETLLGRLGDFETFLISHGANFNGMFGNRIFHPAGVAWIVLFSSIVWFTPNLQDFMGSYSALRPSGFYETRTKYQWKASLFWACILGLTAGMSLLGLSRVSEFLYFQF